MINNKRISYVNLLLCCRTLSKLFDGRCARIYEILALTQVAMTTSLFVVSIHALYFWIGMVVSYWIFFRQICFIHLDKKATEFYLSMCEVVYTKLKLEDVSSFGSNNTNS